MTNYAVLPNVNVIYVNDNSCLRGRKKYLSLEKSKMLVKAFIDCQFNYVLLVWMFCQRGLYLKMQKIHHKTRMVINLSNKAHEEFLQLSETVNIHEQHLSFLVIDVYKCASYLNLKFMWSFFFHKEILHNLTKEQVLSLPPAILTYYETNSVHFRGFLIWNNLPSYITPIRSVCEFISNIKNFRDIDGGMPNMNMQV